MQRAKKIVTRILKWLLVGGVLLIIALVLWRCIGYSIQKSTIRQLRYNLNDERATREELEKQVEKLQTELSNKTMEVNAMNQKQTGATEEDSLYLQAKFPSDGNYYVDANENIFYKDSTCTQVVDNPKFMSCKMDEYLEASNGFAVKAMRLDNGDIVYCPRDTNVHLVTEQEWKEYLKEQQENEEE